MPQLSPNVVDLRPSAGGGGGTDDHGALTGLGDDDHGQYHNDARGDARYYLKATVDAALAGKSDTSHGHSDATTSVPGFMSAADKTKLDGVAAGAEVNQNAFAQVSVAGQSDVVADAKADILTLVAGTGISITTSAAADSVTIAATGGGGGASQLNDLDDVTLTALADNDILQYDAGTSDFINVTPEQLASSLLFANLGDVSIGDPNTLADGDTLYWDQTGGVWVNDVPGVPTHSHAISDVTGLQTALDSKHAINSGKYTIHDLGTVSSGTITPEPSTGAMKKLTNNGAFTLGALTEQGSFIIEVTNGSTAGAIDVSGFTEIIDSDTYATTQAKVFEFIVTYYGGVKRLQIVEIA